MPIENVSDTARWVAVYRAMETERPDAIFRDPYARRLAGDHGEEIVRNMKQGRQMAWAMITRTAVMDQLILGAIREGAELVLNLAAGLDARPWRMAELPPSLRWVDVDLPGILNYKTGMLKDERPRCQYEAVTLDLRERDARRALFARVGATSKRAIVVSEGLLIYLTPGDVGTLADDLSSVPAFKWWLIDLASPMLLKWMVKRWGTHSQAGAAPFLFGPEDGTEFFVPHGWRELAFRSSAEEAKRLKRQMKGAWMWKLFGLIATAKQKAKFKRFSGIVLLERA